MGPILDRDLFHSHQSRPRRTQFRHALTTLAAIATLIPLAGGALGLFTLTDNIAAIKARIVLAVPVPAAPDLHMPQFSAVGPSLHRIASHSASSVMSRWDAASEAIRDVRQEVAAAAPDLRRLQLAAVSESLHRNASESLSFIAHGWNAVSGWFADFFGSSAPAYTYGRDQKTNVATAGATQYAEGDQNGSAAQSSGGMIATSTDSTRSSQASAGHATIVNNYISEPVIERIIERNTVTPAVSGANGVSQAVFEARLQQLEHTFNTRLAASAAQTSATYIPVTTFAPSQRIDTLANTSISNPTITGGSITAASISGTISNALDTLSGAITSLTGTDITYTRASFTEATSTTFFASNLTAPSTTVGTITATSSATSTFAGPLTLSSALLASSGGTGISNPNAAGVLLGSYAGGGWQQIATSSLGLLTTNVAEGSNLYFTNNRVASAIAGTTTDALREGSSNLYFTNDRVAAVIAGTTTSALAEGSNKYYSDARVDARINATSSIGTLTSAPNLGTVATSLTGFLKATAGALSTALVSLASDVTGTLSVANGGTGWSNIAASAVPYGNGTGALATTTTGTNGYVLAYLNGIPTWTATTTTGTGLTYSAGSFNVNTSQNIATLSNLTTNGFITTTGGNGTLAIDTTSYTPTTRTVTAGSGLSGGGDLSSNRTIALDLASANSWTGLQAFANASTSLLSVTSKAYFGGTATSTFDSAGNLALVNNGLTVGTSQLVVSGGNVGIGTTSPYRLLSVAGTAAFNASSINLDNTTGTQFNYNMSSRTINEGVNSAGQFFINDATAPATRFLIHTNGNIGIGDYYSPSNLPQNKLSVAGGASIGFTASGDVAAPSGGLLVSGNVGIGTSTPTSPTGAGTVLNVSDATLGASLTLTDRNTNGRSFDLISSVSAGNAYLGIYDGTANAYRWWLDKNGNVGIGTTSPATTLSVAGNVYATGGLGVGVLNTTAGTLQTSGNATIGGTLAVTGATTLSGALTYGGVTLSNSVTGTGNMVLSASPTFTGTVNTSVISASGNITRTDGTNSNGMTLQSNFAANELHGSSGAFIDYGTVGDDFDFRESFVPSSNSFSFYSSSTNPIITMLGTGNVGIGTTNPGRTLTVTPGAAGGGVRVYTTGSNNPEIQLYDTTDGGATLFSQGGIFRIGRVNSVGSWTANSLSIDTSGNVGINTNNPVMKLDIVTTGTSTDGIQLNSDVYGGNVIIRPNMAAGSTNPLTQQGDSGIFFSSSAGIGTGNLVIAPWSNSSYGIRIQGSTGNIGIGTASPSGKLDVSGAFYTGTGQLVMRTQDGTNEGGEITMTGAGSNSAFTFDNYASIGRIFWSDASSRQFQIYNAGAGSAGLYVQGNVGIGTTTPGTKLNIAGGGLSIEGDSGGNYASGANGLHLTFNTTSNVGRVLALQNNVAWRQLQLDGSNIVLNAATGGNVGIGTTTPWRTLSVAGTVGFDGLTGAFGAGSLCLTANKEVVYNSGSDSCLSSLRSTKHDIQPLSLSATDMVKSLQPVSFIYNNDASSTVRYGFIAEDAAAVESHLGTYDQNGNISGVDDRSMLAIVVEALQSLIDTVDNFANSFTTKELTFVRATGDEIDVRRAVADELCANKSDGTPVCVTGDQLAAMLAGAGASASAGSGAGSAASPYPDASTTPDTTPPTITINGNNPAVIHVGDTYADMGARITGPAPDLNLGIKTFLDGKLVSDIVVDTSSPATSTIDYVATDNAGNAATSTRTVIVEAQDANNPAPVPEDTVTSSVTEDIATTSVATSAAL